MRRLTAWVGGALGGVVAYRWWRRRPEGAVEPSSEPLQPDQRAEELRAKLAETRESDAPPTAEPVEPPEPAEEAPAEPAAVEPAEPPETDEPPEAVEERRERVHEEGRAALDEMKSNGAG